MSISRMMRWGNALGIRCWSTIVKMTCDPFWSAAALSIFSGVFLVLLALTQIIQIRSTKRIRNTTDPATPPAMYANSLFSSHCLPVKEPAHWQKASPRLFFKQMPSFLQKSLQLSVQLPWLPSPLYPSLHLHLYPFVSAKNIQWAFLSQSAISPSPTLHLFVHSSLDLAPSAWVEVSVGHGLQRVSCG